MALQTVRNFGKVRDALEIPALAAIQRESYDAFLQKDVSPTKRSNAGLEALFREVFPIESYDQKMSLEYLSYELEQPRYSAKECRQLRLTYGYPLKITCRLHIEEGEDIVEQSIYIGEMPKMIGGGEFIINGAIRVIVSQLHRSPGVDFLIERKVGDRVLHGGRIIPERGSWVEVAVTRKDVLVIKIDKSSKIPATVLLRALSPDYGKTEDIIRMFYPTQKVSSSKLKSDMWTVGPIVDTETGEIIVGAGRQIGDKVTLLKNSKISTGVVPRAKLSEKEAKKRLGNRKDKKSKAVHKWLEKNQENLRQKYMVKGVQGTRTGGLAFKYAETKNKLKKAELEAVKAKLIESEQPLFNRDSGKTKAQIKKLWDKNEYLEEFYQECKEAIKSKDAWTVVKDLKKSKKGLPDKQGIYFFRSLKTNKVKDGYLGLAMSLKKRLGYDFTGSFAASKKDNSRDEFLKSLAWSELVEHGFPEGGGKSKSSGKVEVIEKVVDQAILNTLAEDKCDDHEQALLKFYTRLRPGNPSNLEKARKFFEDKFFDTNRYRLGKVGRFRLNRKFGQSIDETEMTLRPEDFKNTIDYIIGLRNNEGEIDDIDHLGNRKVRTIDELASEEIRKGMLKLRRTIQERMSSKKTAEKDEVKIADLVNSKSVSSSINYFFGRGELSQIVDQTNALSQLTHERRLSALGPGGLNRRRAGFDVRDVHISHYGRICPIETPEGTNIGLISSLAIYSSVDEYGFLITPYVEVKNGKVTDKVKYLRADEDMRSVIAAPNTVDQKTNKIPKGMVLAMKGGELAQVSSDEVDYVDVSPKQTVGISASLIPFLEHDDANRALMGSNMQRQAIPLLRTEAPLVGTGMEEVVGRNSSMVVRARTKGTVTDVDSQHIVIDGSDEYNLIKFAGLNERTCLNQRPIVKPGDKVKKDQVIADGGGTDGGVLSLGRNVLCGFVSFDGFNFEDAIIVSERLVKDDDFTSIHIDEFTAEVRETRLGREEFTRDIPNVGEKALRNLDEYGVVQEGTRVRTGSILVGKVVPKSKTELTPEEKLLHAIFGRAGEDVKNDSLELPSGYEGVVIRTERFAKRGAGGEEQKKAIKEKIKECTAQIQAKQCVLFRQMTEAVHSKFDVKIVDPSTKQKVGASDDDDVIYEQIEGFDIKWVKPASARDDVQKVIDEYLRKIKELEEEKERKVTNLKHGDELPSGVLEMVKVYIATKRTLSVGDKMAGRHGNKGVIAKIKPEEDMPFLEDGTPLDILLNPLGVPSRMNVGQILETHLGWVAKVLGFRAVTPIFDGVSEEKMEELIAESNGLMKTRRQEYEADKKPPPDDEFFINVPSNTLKTRLYDGRTGEPFEQGVTVGYMYVLKLHHLVDDKIHARATGPYSLITQQPLGGKARTGGQRFGEMEVWALEGYGAAYTLQEVLTVKSDDVEGRTKIYESMVKGKNTLDAGTPLSFDVLCNEIRSLGLNIQLEKKQLGGMGL